MDLKARLSSINESLDTTGKSKVDLALMLLDTKAAVNWKDTKYGTWKEFCNAEIALSQASIYVYLRTAKAALDNNFYKPDMKHVVASIGWQRFRIGLTKIDKSEPVNVIAFIKKFKDLNLNERVTYGDSEDDLVNFTFSLPQSVADDFTNELLAKGMRITNKSRTGMSSAMTKIINDLKDEP